MTYTITVTECQDRARMPREFRVDIFHDVTGRVILDDKVLVTPGRPAQKQLEQLVHETLIMAGELYGQKLQRLICKSADHTQFTLCRACFDRWDFIDLCHCIPDWLADAAAGDPQPGSRQDGDQDDEAGDDRGQIHL